MCCHNRFANTCTYYWQRSFMCSINYSYKQRAAARTLRSPLTTLTRRESVLVAFRICTKPFTELYKLFTQLLFRRRWICTKCIRVFFILIHNLISTTKLQDQLFNFPVLEDGSLPSWFPPLPETHSWNNKTPQGYCSLEERNRMIYKGPWSV